MTTDSAFTTSVIIVPGNRRSASLIASRHHATRQATAFTASQQHITAGMPYENASTTRRYDFTSPPGKAMPSLSLRMLLSGFY